VVALLLVLVLAGVVLDGMAVMVVMEATAVAVAVLRVLQHLKQAVRAVKV
jgi:hypothetical protein